MKTFLVIPAYNEKPSVITSLLQRTVKFVPLAQTIVVDDGSKKPLKLDTKVALLRHDLNLGKGAALKTGCSFAFRSGADNIVMMDSDGQHDPKELKHFLSFLKQDFDLVFGSRRPTIDAPLVRLLGNKFASVYINLMFGAYVSDILSGFRAFNKRAYNLIRWSSPRYGVETEMVARLGKHKDKLRFIEFPIETIYIDKYKGVTILDAFKIFFYSLWWKLF